MPPRMLSWLSWVTEGGRRRPSRPADPAQPPGDGISMWGAPLLGSQHVRALRLVYCLSEHPGIPGGRAADPPPNQLISVSCSPLSTLPGP